MTDKLEEIVTLQRQFMEQLGVPVMNLEEPEVSSNNVRVQQMIPHIMFALVCELGEIGDEINWKSWKKTKIRINHANLRMELIDALHFLLEMMIMCGMGANDIFIEYKMKMTENLDRQKRGY